MKIRLLNDLHKESGPYTYEDQGEDVVVLAGDIGNGIEGIEWAKTIPKPVIYVAGNHEFWGQPDFHETLTAMKNAAKGSNVRFLERNAVKIKINGETVRFLGCTLWTNYCNGSRNMYQAALNGVRDYSKIKAPAWNDSNRKRIDAFSKKVGFSRSEEQADHLHPLMLMDINRRSVQWLERQIKSLNDGIKNVIVTHHAPSFESLIRANMIARTYVGKHDQIRVRGEEAMRMAAYASDFDWLLKRYSRKIDLWCHGHVHEPLDYALRGVRVACNPRGYFDPPLTLESASAMAMFGYGVSPDAIASDVAAFASNPERGSVSGFERAKVIDLDVGLLPCLVPQARAQAEALSPLIAELHAIAGSKRLKDAEMRPVFIRAIDRIFDDVNAIQRAIATERESAGANNYGLIRFPQQIRPWFRIEVPIIETLMEATKDVEAMHEFFIGNSYEQSLKERY